MALEFALQGPEAGSNPDSVSTPEPMARLAELAGERIVLLTNRAAPPGAPVVLRAPDGQTFEAKTRGCQRSAQTGVFRLEARLVNLSRAARERLGEFMNPPGLPASSQTKDHPTR